MVVFFRLAVPWRQGKSSEVLHSPLSEVFTPRYLKFFTPRYMYRYVHCSVLWMIQGWVSIPICKLSAESPLWDKMVSVKGRPNKIFTLKDPRRFFTLSYFFVASYQAQFKIRGYVYNFLQTPHITYKVTLHMMGSPDSVHNRESYW
jgi:hypothetical protein